MRRMGTLTIVRHGQASFLADDYDQLSPQGIEQSERLGQYWGLRGQQFDAVYLGSLKRHAQTFAGIDAGLKLDVPVHVRPGLNEYDSHAVIEATHASPLPPRDTPEGFKQHFRILRDGLRQWMDGTVNPKGMPSYQDFVAGIVAVGREICDQHVNQNVLLVSSGGPISTLVGHLLATMPETTIELNYQIRNTAITEMRITPKRLKFMTFNGLPHLDAMADRALHTYA